MDSLGSGLSVISLSLHSFSFFLFISSDSSCHNKLLVMLECKLLVQAEPSNFEPSGGPAFPPKEWGGERRSQVNAYQHVGFMLRSTEAWHLLC